MATGDIINAEIISSGWQLEVTIEGWGARAGTITYAYDADGTPLLSLAVTSEGYNGSGVLGTVARTVLGTTTNRQPYPNEALLQEVVSGPDLIVRIALSEFIYNDDRNGGVGTSGVDPVLTISAGWATSSVGPASVPPTVFTVGNNSAMDYPVAFGQWDPYAGTLTASRVKANFPLAFNARHGHGIACVRFNAVGNTSAVDTELFATTQTGTMRTATSLYGYAYQVTIPIAGYTQGETITSRARVYPIVGDADSVQDTNGRTTAANECLGWNSLILTCDKNDLLEAAKYVSTTGNDTTGDGSSGNPWLTINKAIKDTNTFTVYLMGTGTTYDLTFSGTRRTATRWVEVKANTGATPTVRMINTSAAARQPKVERLLFRDLPVLKSAASSYLDGDDADNFLAFVGCTFDDGGFGVSGDAGPGYRFDACYMVNCGGDLNRAGWRISTFGTARAAYIFDGIAFLADAAGASGMDAWYRVVACSGTNQSFAFKAAANPAPTFNGVLFECNQFLNNTLTSANVIYLNLALAGCSIIGNVIEKTAGSGACVHLVADATTAAMTNVVMAHNTFVGSTTGRRVNIFYNDQGTTPYYHIPVFLRGNQIDECNIKSDTFGHTAVSITQTAGVATLTCASADSSAAYAVAGSIVIQGANQADYNGTFAVASSSGTVGGGTLTFAVNPAAASPATGTITYFGLGRVGNWSVIRGTGMRSNNFDTASSTSFEWEYGGLNFTEATPTFVDAANNDFMPVAGDGLTNRVTNGYLPGDLFGTLRTTMDVGAVQRPADPPTSSVTYGIRNRIRVRAR